RMVGGPLSINHLISLAMVYAGARRRPAAAAASAAPETSWASALGALPDRVAQGTRLDLALLRGAEALSPPARRHDNNPVLVLMTDGLPNRVPIPPAGGSQADTVLQAAAAAKAGGAVVYTIGVGRPDDPDPLGGIDATLLRRVASRPDMYYQAPDAEDLESIYQAIAHTIACPPAGQSLDERGPRTYRYTRGPPRADLGPRATNPPAAAKVRRKNAGGAGPPG
ncbi:MAG: VWA domain-containing protein, partial [Anaerolineae bacterium]